GLQQGIGIVQSGVAHAGYRSANQGSLQPRQHALSTWRDAKKRRQEAKRLDKCPRSLRANFKTRSAKQGSQRQLRIRQTQDRRAEKQKATTGSESEPRTAAARRRIATKAA